MKLFEVTFESPGFVDTRKNARKIEEAELSESFVVAYNEQATKEGEFPSGVVGVVSGQLSEDDGQGNSDIKVFASIVLLIAAKDADAAESFEPQVELLSSLTDSMCTIEDECLLSLENAWEATDFEIVEGWEALDDGCFKVVIPACDSFREWIGLARPLDDGGWIIETNYGADAETSTRAEAFDVLRTWRKEAVDLRDIARSYPLNSMSPA